MTLNQIRRSLSAAYSATWFQAATNETFYPARWSMGAGAGDASTACHYDRRRTLAAEHVAAQLRLDLDFDDCLRLRDCADMIAAALRERAAADAAIDATADAEIA